MKRLHISNKTAGRLISILCFISLIAGSVPAGTVYADSQEYEGIPSVRSASYSLSSEGELGLVSYARDTGSAEGEDPAGTSGSAGTLQDSYETDEVSTSEMGGCIPLEIDYGVPSVVEDRDFDYSLATVGADSSRDIKLFAAGAQAACYPASYKDSAAVLEGLNERMPQTRSQGSYQTCWSFSTIASMEGALINTLGYEPSDTDLSELHLAYYANHYSLDNGDGNCDTVEFSLANKTYLSYGGNAFIALGALGNRTGAVDESDMPYTGADATLSGVVSAEQDDCVVTLTGWQAYSLSDESDRELVKAAIKSGGAVTAMMYYTSSCYNSTYNSYYSSTTGINHGVALVGWDDDFPKEYFGGSISENGAWIVRNSWSSTSKMDKNSYFYISYYNPCNYTGVGQTAYALTVTDRDSDYDNIYQYDGAIASMGRINSGQSTFKGGNVFTASRKEEIKAAAFQTYYKTVNTEYTVEVYTDLEEGTEDPTAGTLASTVSGNTTAPGLYRVELPSPVGVEKGDVFSIVVTLTKTDGEPFMGVETAKSAAPWMTITNLAVSEGQSILYDHEKSGGAGWVDMTEYQGYGNLRIKAFTDTKRVIYPDEMTAMNLNLTDISLLRGEKATLSVNSFEPEGCLHGDRVSFASENESVATVSENGVITAVSPGTAVITASCDDGYGYDVNAKCNVTVNKYPDELTGMTLNASELSLVPGESFDLSVVSFEPEGCRHGDKLIYASDNEDVVTVTEDGTVSAKEPGSAVLSVSCDSGYGCIVTAECKVTVSFAGTKKLTLSKSGTVKMKPGEIYELTATVTPEEASDNIYVISSSPRVASVSQNGCTCYVTAGVTGSSTVTVVSGHLKKSVKVKVEKEDRSYTQMKWEDLDASTLYPGEIYELMTDWEGTAWSISGSGVSFNKKKQTLKVTKAGNPILSMVSCLNQNVTVTQKEICVRQPLKFFKLSSSCKTTTAPKSGKIKRVTFGIGQNPAGKKFTGVVTWNITGGEWLTIDTDRSTGNKGVFIISDKAMSGESAYVTAVITDSVTGESYSDTAMVCIK